MAIFDSNSRQGIYNFQNILGILVGWFPVSSLKAKGLKQMVQKQIEKCFEVVTKTRLQRSQSSSFICWWVLAQFSSHMIHTLVLFFFFFHKQNQQKTGKPTVASLYSLVAFLEGSRLAQVYQIMMTNYFSSCMPICCSTGFQLSNQSMKK